MNTDSVSQNNNNDVSYKYNKNNFTLASIIMGTLAIFTSSTIIFPIFFGSLGIIFAILSKGKYTKMSSYGKVGFETSLIGIIFAICIGIYSFYMLATNETYQKEVDSLFQQMYGVSAEEFYQKTINDYNNIYIENH